MGAMYWRPRGLRPRGGERHTSSGRMKGARSSAAWRTCQSRSSSAAASAASTSGPSNGRERQHGSAADGRLVGAPGEDRRQPAFVADRAERRDRGLADQRIVGAVARPMSTVEHGVVGSATVLLARRPRRGLDDGRLRGRASSASSDTAGRSASIVATRRRTARLRVGERGAQVVVRQGAHAAQGAECQLAGHGIGGRERGRVRRPRRPRGRRRRRRRQSSSLQHVGEGDHGVGDPETDDGGQHRTHPARRAPRWPGPTRRAVRTGTGRSIGVRTGPSTSTPVGARCGRRARAGSAVALAVLRHPVAIKATMARPAIQPAARVTSVILTQSDTRTDGSSARQHAVETVTGGGPCRWRSSASSDWSS